MKEKRRVGNMLRFSSPSFVLDHYRHTGSEGRSFSQQKKADALRLVRFLYIIRCPHSLQRIGSLGLISFFAPQSVFSGECFGCALGEWISHLHRDTPFPDEACVLR